MFTKELAVLAAGVSTASAAIYQGFNYAAETDFATEFALAKSLTGTSGAFTSARLYTTIEEGTSTTPTSAIPAAIAADVTLLLGLWASAGQATITNEIAALKAAIATYGTEFTSRVAGISVGSEDLYRISPTGIINKSGLGAEPSDLVSYIAQVRTAIAGTGLASVPVGHVDTWTAWVNGSNSAVTSASDFIGMDAYPYFQTTQSNGIENAYDLFFSAYDQTVAASLGKAVWVTETGWPASGPDAGSAVPSTANAETYWQQVACKLLGTTNTWWYTLNDAGASPSFGVTTGSSTPLYDLTCSVSSSSASSTTSASSTSASAAASGSSTGAAASTSAAAATTAVSSSAVSASNVIVPVTSSAVPSQNGGSPGASSSAVADASAASASSVSPAGSSSALAAASSALSAASTDSTATIVAASTAAASGSSTAAGTTLATSVAAASSAAVSSAAGAASSVVASSAAGSGTTGASSSTTASAAVTTYTGGASTLQSTGGFIAAIAAMLAAI